MSVHTTPQHSPTVTGATVTVPVLGDPHGMRPAQKRYWNGLIGEYLLDDGRTVWCIWLPTSQTHTHIIVWDSEEVSETVENVCRLHAARATEALFVAMES